MQDAQDMRGAQNAQNAQNAQGAQGAQGAQQGAQSAQGAQQGAQNMQNGGVPNIVEGRDGWYPRWWLLAALCYCVVLVALMLLWTPVICVVQQRHALPLICQVSNWWYPVKVFLFWGIFAAFWLLFFSFGFGLVEVPQADENPVGKVLRALTQFAALRPVLLIQGGVALLLVNVMWWLDHSPPAAFATLGVVMFLAHCSLFYPLPAPTRLNYAVGYGVVATINFVAQMSIRRDFLTRWPNLPADEWPLLCVEIILFVIGVATITILLRRRAQYRTAQAARNAHIDQATQPFNVLRNMWPFSRLWPQQPPPVAADDDEDDLQWNPDPGAP